MDDPHMLALRVNTFIDTVFDILEQVTAQLPPLSSPLRREDVINEAFQLCAAFIDADDRHTDTELWALSGTFGGFPSFTHIAGATPATLRAASVVAGAKTWLNQVSPLFDILTTADSKNPGERAMTYYRLALDIAHFLASLDAVTAQQELDAIAAYRRLLLNHIHHVVPAGLPDAPPPAHPSPSLNPPDATTGEKRDTPASLSPSRPLEELLSELHALVGLQEVKEQVQLVTDFLSVQKLRKERGLPTIDTTLHLIFEGNPGTGKTTVARLLAQIYRALGALESGHLVEKDRSTLVAGFVGQTAPLMVAAFNEAQGGMLFIDEAYTLHRGGDNDFGQEAIDQMVKLMEDRRDAVAVIVAGYPDEMHTFIDSNPGLASRFFRTITFPDYSTKELQTIFEGLCTKNKYQLTEESTQQLVDILSAVPRGKGFGNARFVRNVFETAVQRHASRVAVMAKPSDSELQIFLPADIAVPTERGGT